MSIALPWPKSTAWSSAKAPFSMRMNTSWLVMPCSWRSKNARKIMGSSRSARTAVISSTSDMPIMSTAAWTKFPSEAITA